MSRPNLSVTPISSVNTTVNRSADTPRPTLETISDENRLSNSDNMSSNRTPSILRSSISVSSSNKSVTFGDEVDVVQISTNNSPDKLEQSTASKLEQSTASKSTDWSLSDSETDHLTKILLENLKRAEGKLDQLDADVMGSEKEPAQEMSGQHQQSDHTNTVIETIHSQETFEDISASINEKLELLDKMSDSDAISEETPKESTKLSILGDTSSQLGSENIQYSSISNSGSSSGTIRADERISKTPPTGEERAVNPLSVIPHMEFGVQQSPVKLSEDDMKELHDLTSSFDHSSSLGSTKKTDTSLAQSSSFEITNQIVEWAIEHGLAAVRNSADSSRNVLSESDTSQSIDGLVDKLAEWYLEHGNTSKSPTVLSNVSDSKESTNRIEPAGGITEEYEPQIENDTLDRILSSENSENFSEFSKLRDQSVSTSMHSFLQHEQETAKEQSDENGATDTTMPEEYIDPKPTMSAQELLKEVTALHQSFKENETLDYLQEPELTASFHALDQGTNPETDPTTTNAGAGPSSVPSSPDNSLQIQQLQQLSSQISNQNAPTSISDSLSSLNLQEAENLKNKLLRKISQVPEVVPEEVPEDVPEDVPEEVPEDGIPPIDDEEDVAPHPPSGRPLSIQEAFLLRKKKFIQKSQLRQEKVKGNRVDLKT